MKSLLIVSSFIFALFIAGFAATGEARAAAGPTPPPRCIASYTTFGVYAARVSSTIITWDWPDISGAVNYRVYLDGSAWWRAVTASSYYQSGLKTGTYHSLRVQAIDVCNQIIGEGSSGKVKTSAGNAAPFDDRYVP